MVTPQTEEQLPLTPPAPEAPALDAVDNIESQLLGGEDATPTAPPETEPQPEPQPTPEQTRLQALEAREAQLREENTRLQREAAQRSREAEEARLQQEVAAEARQWMQEYVQQGYDETTARQMAVLRGREAVASIRAENERMERTRVELHYQYNVPLEQLNGFRDEAAMRHFAEQYNTVIGPQARENAELRARLERLERERVPVQAYNQPTGAPAGREVPSEQNIDRLYNEFATQYPGRVNPYTDAYRRVMNGQPIS